MKRILFLLLLTVSVYGQNPSRFANIQITGNSNSTTATKVNVQEANGAVNTQTINTGFNKNIGLGGSDVVGATTLLNQYSTTPIDWTATTFNSGQVVFYGGKQWLAKIATVAGDVPAVSPKWDEITFEALANKTVTVDQTIIDGSTNAVSGNAVFDGLATKAPISSVHNPVTLGTANGLSLATQQLSLGLASSGNAGALSGTDWNTFNNKQNALTNPITGTGVAGQISFWSGTGTQTSDSGLTWDGTTGLVSKKQIILDAQNTAFIIGNNTPTNFAQFYYNSVNKALQFTKSNGDNTIVVKDVTGNVGINQVLPTEKLDVVGNGKFSGTVTASPATTANQVPTWGQVQAAARPYKVFTALVTQIGIGSPSVVVLENTLGISEAMSRNAVGHYGGQFLTNQVYNKVACFVTSNNSGIVVASYCSPSGGGYWIDTASVSGGVLTPYDGALNNATLEIRVYN